MHAKNNITTLYSPILHLNDTDSSEVHIYKLKKTGVNVIIAVNSLSRGPAIGGCRYIKYKHTNDAIADAINLASAMTLKAAFHNLPHGGAKTVIIKPEHEICSKTLFHEFADLLNDMRGKYITSLDSGTNYEDMQHLFEKTSYVLGHESDSSSDPSYYTAKGVKSAMIAASLHKFNSSSLKGRKIAIMGVGNVGEYLLQLLRPEAANITITDTNTQKAKDFANKYNCSYMPIEGFTPQECDILVPCALGNIITKQNIKNLQTEIICGASNNQLSDNSLALELKNQNILYVPDYVANGGGLIFAAAKYRKDTSEVNSAICSIKDKVVELLQISADSNITPLEVANKIAFDKIKND